LLPSTCRLRCVIALLGVLCSSAALAAPIWVDGRADAASASAAEVAAATERAIHEATLNGSRIVARRQLDAQTWAAERPTIELFLRTKGPEFLTLSRHEKSRIEDGNIVHVWMTVAFREDALGAALRAALAGPDTAIVVVAPNAGVPAAAALALEARVTDATLAAGGAVVSEELLREARWQTQLTALRRGDYAAARELGAGVLADTVVRIALAVEPGQNNQGIISAHATASIEAVNCPDARVLFAQQFGPERGFGADATRAATDACGKLASPVAEYVAAQLVGQQEPRTVKVVSPMNLTPGKWEALAVGLRGAPLVREVLIDRGRLVCTTGGTAFTLAVAADQADGFRVVSCSEESVSVELQSE
jgi:hypothetical protein